MFLSPILYSNVQVLAMLNEFLENLKQWIDEIPPIQQPMRFGNKAFRDFHQRLVEVFF